MPKSTPSVQSALVFQGGGALGAYQAGVYEALAEESEQPDWIAGISIGAINAAILAGNDIESRLPRLREFWDTVSSRRVSETAVWRDIDSSRGNRRNSRIFQTQIPIIRLADKGKRFSVRPI
jgi:NTE family protein